MSGSPQEHLVQRSVVRETKEKFDSLLKNALQETSPPNMKENPKPRTRSQQSTFPLHNFNDTNEEENKEFILNKFFENNASVHEVKPIPKPRTKLRSKNLENSTLSPHSSNETFKISTPKVISSDRNKIQSNASSLSSTNTYKVSSPKIVNAQDDELSSQRTFKISKKAEPKIGDIIIHEKDSVSKIVDVQVKNGFRTYSPVPPEESVLEIRSNSSNSSKVSDSKSKTFIKSNASIHDEIITREDPKLTDEKVANILNMKIHKTDKLLLNSLVTHPVVKIHIVDIHTGNYISKKFNDKSVNYYEDNLDYIAPIMTHPYSLQEKRSLIPSWEETILINEDYDYFVEQKENTIIFFEILDFLSAPLIKNKTKGWHRIAVAFLKIAGKNNVLNFNKNMRLQLYYCSLRKEDTRKCSIWETWNKGKLAKYPSSLYISITNSEMKDKTSASSRSLSQLENKTDEISETANKENFQKDEFKNNIISFLKNTVDENQEWRRNSKEITKLPNDCLAQFETEKEGCFTLRFSNNGSLLACSMKLNDVYCIVIFSVVTFEQICFLPGHQDLIYAIRWSPDDSLIIACSADCSVSIWDVGQVTFLQILPHPNFVYANDISSNFIVTGCYDTKLRIWNKEELSSKYVLYQELDGHKGYITSMLFKKSHDTVFSSDSLGVIIEWYKQKNTWVLHKKINIMGLEGIIINQIKLLAKEKRLLVHSRDNILRIMDLESSIVVHWLQGGLNSRFHTSCSVSPCGNFIIAGSENSSVNIWKVKTGKCVGSLVPYKNRTVTIHALQFHPKDNMIAVGSFGDDLPVLLFGFNGKNRDKNIDLRMIADKRSDVKDGDNSKNSNILKSDKDKFNFKHVLDRLDNLMSGKLN